MVLREYIQRCLLSALEEQRKKEKVDTLVRHIDVIGPNEHKYVILAGDLDTNEVFGHMDISVLDNEAHIDWVKVKPEHQRQGVATAIYKKLNQWASEEGFKIVGGMRTPEGEKLRASLEEQKTKSYQAHYKGIKATKTLDSLAKIARKIQSFNFESTTLRSTLIQLCVEKAKRFGLCGQLVPEEKCWKKLVDYHKQEDLEIQRVL